MTMRRVSHYPPPYPPSPYGQPQPPIDFSYYTPQADLLAPARRAAILQGILGVLVLACGVCLGVFPWVVNINEAVAQSGMTIPELPAGMSLESLFRTVYTAIGVVGGLIGVALLVLAFFVRNGGRGAAITSLVLQGLIVAVLLLNLLTAIVQTASTPAIGIVTLLMITVLLMPFALNIFWLVGAIRAGSRIGMARQQYAAEYHQYQQQQQAYGQAGLYGMSPAPQGYGYAQPPPHAAPASQQPQAGAYGGYPPVPPMAPPPSPPPVDSREE